MKILWVSHLVPYPPKAGVLIRSHYLVKELARHHDVHVLAFNQRGLIEPYFDDYQQGTIEAERVLSEYCKSVHIFDCPTDKNRYQKYWCALKSLFTKRPYTINWLHSEPFAQKLDDLHSRFSFDLVHFDTISLAPYAAIVRSAATSLDHHNVESHMLLRRSALENNLIKKAYYYQEGLRLKKLEKLYCPQFDTNITCSDLDSARFRDYIPHANFKTIPNGVDVEYFVPNPNPERDKSIIFVGTLDWYPNIRAVKFIAFDIWPHLKQDFDDIRADIIGSRPPNELVEFAKSEPDLNVHGFVDDIIPPIQSAAVYVCPINDGGGTKLKLLDAFAAGKAVVADPVACEGLEISDGENVLLATSAQEFATQIKRLILDKDLREKLELNARRHAMENFSFRAIGAQLAEHFGEVYRQSRNGSSQ